MAKKKDNTLLIVGGVAVAGYLFWQYKQTQAPAANTTAANASTGVLSVPPTQQTVHSAPPQAALPAYNYPPANNAPNPVAVNTTGLTPVSIGPGNVPVLAPGQSLAINQNGTPVTSSSGQPMVFAPVQPQPVVSDALYESFIHGNYPGASGGGTAAYPQAAIMGFEC